MYFENKHLNSSLYLIKLLTEYHELIKQKFIKGKQTKNKTKKTKTKTKQKQITDILNKHPHACTMIFLNTSVS